MNRDANLSSAMQLDALESRTLMSAASAPIDLNNAYVGDLNGDHKADIAAVRDGRLVMFAGDGLGSAHAWATFPSDYRLTHVAAGDVNGDGSIDLIATGIVSGTAASGDSLLVTTYLSHGNGTWEDTDIVHSTATLPHDSYDSLAADFDGDGKTDLAFAGRSNGIIGVLIALFRDNDSFGQPQTITSPFAPGSSVAAGDVNGDGRADLVSLDANGHTGVAMGISGGTSAGIFDDPFFFNVNAVGTPPTQRQLIADVDGDGADDIVGFSNGTARIARLMEEEGIFYFTATNANNLPPDVQANSAVADLDGNRTGDLLAFRTTGRAFTAYTDEHGIFTPSGPAR